MMINYGVSVVVVKFTRTPHKHSRTICLRIILYSFWSWFQVKMNSCPNTWLRYMAYLMIVIVVIANDVGAYVDKVLDQPTYLRLNKV